MDNISLKLTYRYKSLQEGFERKDIPPFAVITGVNGVGKTQLLEVVKGRSERTDNRVRAIQIVRETASSRGPESLFFSENQRGLSLNGLIEYVQNADQRLLVIRNLDSDIRNCRNNINNWRQQYFQATDKVRETKGQVPVS